MKWFRGLFPSDAFMLFFLFILACSCALASMLNPSPIDGDMMLWFMAGLAAGT